MKPSHTTTPRTLADCTFTVGHHSADTHGADLREFGRIAWGFLCWTALAVALGYAAAGMI